MSLVAPRLAESPAPDETTTASSALEELVAAADRIEPLPVSVTRLSLLVSDSEADIREIVEVISYDQSLAANLLRQVNSAALGGRVRIQTVHDAVMRLGIGTLFTLALGASVKTAMAQAIPSFGLAEGELWRHSVAASLAADVIRSTSPRSIALEASTAALLHDFGKMVMARHFGPTLLDACAVAAQHDGVSRLEAEHSVFGFTHAVGGALVADRWNLPLAVIDGIRDHHRCDDDMSVVSRVVALADFIATDMFAEAPDPTQCETRAAHLRGLRLDGDSYPALVQKTVTDFSQLAARFGIN